MSTIALPNTFTSGTTIQSAQVNSNFTTIYNDYNGNITNANIASGAAIAASKLSLATIAQTIAMSGTAINFAKGGDIASATTTNIGAATGNTVHITGTTTITAFDTVQAGTWRYLIFDGALILTHNGTSLILPTAANITTVAGDTALMMSEGSGNWRCLSYNRKTGSAVLAGATAYTNATAQVSSDLTTTSASYADIAGVTLTFTVGQAGLVTASFSGSSNGAGSTTNNVGYAILVDAAIVHQTVSRAATSSVMMGISLSWSGSLAAGSHTIKIQNKTAGGTETLMGATNGPATLTVAYPT